MSVDGIIKQILVEFRKNQKCTEACVGVFGGQKHRKCADRGERVSIHQHIYHTLDNMVICHFNPSWTQHLKFLNLFNFLSFNIQI